MASDSKKKKTSGTSKSKAGSRNSYDYERTGSSRSSSNRNSSGRPSSGKKGMSKKQRAKRKRRKMLIFVLEIFVILIMLMVLWAVIRTEGGIGRVDIKDEDIVINEEVQENETLQGYRNIALFGVDDRNGKLGKGVRTDTIMVASINMDSGDIKLCSVYRDTYLNRGNDTYNKCNGAYANGGPEQAINMLNMNMDLDITDYVTIGFAGMKSVIDALGGVEINVTEDEIVHLNNYMYSMVKEDPVVGLAGLSYTEVTHAGTQTLDGLQALAYCRIRYTKGDDFRRAERQRTVLLAIMDKAKQASAKDLTAVANSVFDEKMISTSLDISEILSLLGDVGKYKVVANDGFPQADMRTTGSIGKKGSCVIPLDLTDNVKWLHEFLFDDPNYTPSDAVQKYSRQIESDTSPYVGTK